MFSILLCPSKIRMAGTWLASGYFGMTVEVLLNVYGHHPDH